MNYEEVYNQTTGYSEKISLLKSYLSSPESEYGDWKIIKILEARLLNQLDPYDLAALKSAREKIRSEINVLEKLEEEAF